MSLDEYKRYKRQVLNQVKMILYSEHKWCKKQFRTSDGKVCLLEAIRSANVTEPYIGAILDVQIDILAHQKKKYKSIVEFNDAAATKYEHILKEINHQLGFS